jgi:hypothetical protein
MPMPSKTPEPTNDARKPVKVYPLVGQRVRVVGCWSEVMMHFGLAEKPVEIALTGGPHPMAEVYVNGRLFSAPITPGEAGFYWDDTRKRHYTYPADDAPTLTLVVA